MIALPFQALYSEGERLRLHPQRSAYRQTDCISLDRQGLPVPRPDKHNDKVVVVDNNNESP